MIYDLGGYGAVRTWEKFKDMIQKYRDEFFAQEMQKIKTRNEG